MSPAVQSKNLSMRLLKEEVWTGRKSSGSENSASSLAWNKKVKGVEKCLSPADRVSRVVWIAASIQVAPCFMAITAHHPSLVYRLLIKEDSTSVNCICALGHDAEKKHNCPLNPFSGLKKVPNWSLQKQILKPLKFLIKPLPHHLYFGTQTYTSYCTDKFVVRGDEVSDPIMSTPSA